MNRTRLLMLPELRVQIEPRRFRVADLAVYRDPFPQGRYGTTPAFIIVEIVSPDDRYGRLTNRLEDYRRWGVPHVWLVDPELKRLYEYSDAGLLQSKLIKGATLKGRLGLNQYCSPRRRQGCACLLYSRPHPHAAGG